MSTAPTTHHAPADSTGTQFLFVMAAAFGVLVVTIIGGVFLPVVVGVALVFAVLAVVLVVVCAYLMRLMGDDD